uniref:Uncharacterized protein n=1 Tax=Anguilla anguilla TaxID=7936 RepID=A0A0E9QSM7_ANGAN
MLAQSIIQTTYQMQYTAPFR